MDATWRTSFLVQRANPRLRVARGHADHEGGFRRSIQARADRGTDLAGGRQAVRRAEVGARITSPRSAPGARVGGRAYRESSAAARAARDPAARGAPQIF